MYLVDFQGSAEWHGKLKGLLQELGWAKKLKISTPFSLREARQMIQLSADSLLLTVPLTAP
jgi:hypothetical protein